MKDDNNKAVKAFSTLAGGVEIGNAPLVFFEDASAAGMSGGVGRILLTAQLHEIGADGQVAVRRATIAHLRGSMQALATLRDLITKLEQAMMPPRTDEGVN